MNDRKLLELAAKAYWGDEIDDICSIRWLDKDECIGYTHGDNQDHNGSDVEYCWNPLTDDGHALRLAVKRKIDVWWAEDGSKVFAQDANGLKPAVTVTVKDCSTEEEATRRAIARAAAIGESM